MITKETRFESMIKTPKLRRKQIILDALGKDTLTAREIAYRLNYSDLNYVKPRLTELLYAGQIKAVDKKLDVITNRKVAVYKAVS